MNISIKGAARWLYRHPKVKQWAWFIGLWCASLSAVLILTYPLKLLVRAMSRH